MKRLIFVLVLLTWIPAMANSQSLSIGTLPAADSLALHVAVDEGLFEAEGLSVELHLFSSAIELSVAVRAGALNGYFGDIINVLLLHAAGIDQTIVATTSHSARDYDEAQKSGLGRHFGVAVRPGSDVNSPEALKGRQVAIGRATIIDFLLDAMLARDGFPSDYVEHLDIRQIPVRLQMLMAGKIDAAVLPEPMLSLVEAQGAHVILDDRGLDIPLAVVSLNKNVADNKTASSLRVALARAMTRINEDPERYRALMIEKKLLPAAASPGYRMVRFDLDVMPYTLPSCSELERTLEWMRQKRLVKRTVSLEGMLCE